VKNRPSGRAHPVKDTVRDGTPQVTAPADDGAQDNDGVHQLQLRKITRNRGHFPDDDTAIKLLYLGIRNITGRHIDGDGLALARGERGTGTCGWKAALNAFAVRLATASRSNPPTHYPK
jgi:hypothetical protein